MVYKNRSRPFSVGIKLNDCRRISLAAIKKCRLIPFKDAAGMISFGSPALAEPCMITFVRPAK